MEFAFLFTLAFCIIEFLAGRFTRSLALTADAGHMLTDVSSLGLSIFAARMSLKSPTPRFTYGFYRIEILSALINGAALLTIAVFIVLNAYARLSEPPSINSPVMITVAVAGLLFNVATGFMLAKSAHKNINIRAAFFHVVSDALSSAGAVAAGILILKTGWQQADAVVSFFIAALIVVSAIRLLKDVAEVLLEAVPRHIDIAEVERRMVSVSGISAIHDLHIWSITSGKEALSAHLEVSAEAVPDSILEQVNTILANDFGIDHTTLQIECAVRPRQGKSCEH